jgi:hypothetical protein
LSQDINPAFPRKSNIPGHRSLPQWIGPQTVARDGRRAKVTAATSLLVIIRCPLAFSQRPMFGPSWGTERLSPTYWRSKSMSLNKFVVSSAAVLAIALSGAVFAETAADKALEAAKSAEKAEAAADIADQKKAAAAEAAMAKHPKNPEAADMAEEMQQNAAERASELDKAVHTEVEDATNAVLKDEAKPIGGY